MDTLTVFILLCLLFTWWGIILIAEAPNKTIKIVYIILIVLGWTVSIYNSSLIPYKTTQAPITPDTTIVIQEMNTQIAKYQDLKIITELDTTVADSTQYWYVDSSWNVYGKFLNAKLTNKLK